MESRFLLSLVVFIEADAEREAKAKTDAYLSSGWAIVNAEDYWKVRGEYRIEAERFINVKLRENAVVRALSLLHELGSTWVMSDPACSAPGMMDVSGQAVDCELPFLTIFFGLTEK